MSGPPRHHEDARPDAPPPHTPMPPLEIEVRSLRTHEEFLACVDLQRMIWGDAFGEAVPASLLKVCPRIGGITAGAFDASDQLLGFVFGMTGIEDGRLVHWSDMLAVRPELRDRGIGRQLKEFQRDALAPLGIDRIYWTFDPLVARNAHFNFNRLGVRVVEYAVDLYGDSDSPLHLGLGTDRFIVAWSIAPPATRAPRAPRAAIAAEQSADVLSSRILNASDRDGVPTLLEMEALPARPILRVEIPLDIERVRAGSGETAALWRTTTRHTLRWALEQRYDVCAFYRDDAAGRGYYVLSRACDPTAANA